MWTERSQVSEVSRRQPIEEDSCFFRLMPASVCHHMPISDSKVIPEDKIKPNAPNARENL
jgi:hypothetical protein